MERFDISGATSDTHLVALWLGGRPDSTRRVYSPVAEGFLTSLAPKTLRDVTVADIVEWSEGLVGADATRSRFISTIKSLLSFAWRTGYTPVNAGRLLRCVKVADRLHEKIIEEGDVQAMVNAATPGRDQALVRVLYVGGLRISEALHLRWVDVTPGRVTVLGKGKRMRTVVVPRSITDGLLALKPTGAEATDYVFRSYRGNRLDDRSAREVIYEAARASGLKASPHFLRHAHATHAMDRGAPLHVVSKSLGHSNIATTSRYLHARPDTGSSAFLGSV